MDDSHINIEAHIRHAKQLRSEALGALVAAGLSRLATFLNTLIHHRPVTNTLTRSPSALIGMRH